MALSYQCFSSYIRWHRRGGRSGSCDDTHIHWTASNAHREILQNHLLGGVAIRAENVLIRCEFLERVDEVVLLVRESHVLHLPAAAQIPARSQCSWPSSLRSFSWMLVWFHLALTGTVEKYNAGVPNRHGGGERRDRKPQPITSALSGMHSLCSMYSRTTSVPVILVTACWGVSLRLYMYLLIANADRACCLAPPRWSKLISHPRSSFSADTIPATHHCPERNASGHGAVCWRDQKAGELAFPSHRCERWR